MTRDEMYSAMLALAEKRGQQWETVVVSAFPKLSSINESITLGSFAWILQSSHVRLVKQSFARFIGDCVVTPSELARDYLSIKYPKPLRCNGIQARDFEKKRQHPLFAIRGDYPDAVYLDLRAAYWAILQVVGWNVEYSTGRFFGVGQSVNDFPFPSDKLARNCLITAGLSSERRTWMYKTQQISSKGMGNRHKNLGLWCCVQDVLNGIATDAVRAGAVYVHTDGYIVPSDQAYKVTTAINNWGLTARLKDQGAGSVYGAGAYKMPTMGGRRKIVREQNWYGIRTPDNLNWLRGKFRHFAERTEFVWD